MQVAGDVRGDCSDLSRERVGVEAVGGAGQRHRRQGGPIATEDWCSDAGDAEERLLPVERDACRSDRLQMLDERLRFDDGVRRLT